MDRRRLSYASVAGGNAGAANTTTGGIFNTLANPTTSSPTRNSFHPSAHTERAAVPPYPFAEESSKSKQAFWADSAATQMPWLDGGGGEEDDGDSQEKMSIRPTYLFSSQYLGKLDTQYRDKLTKQADQKTPSLSKSSSGASLQQRMAPSHRGMTYEIVENTPVDMEDFLTPPLPSKWDQKDKNGGLEIIRDFELKYVATNRVPDLDAAAARTDHPIPRMAGIYYYEVTVLAKGKDGTIAIGFSSAKAALEKLPGWEPESWAYHGDDGKAFGCALVGKHCGPLFKVDDVVGCGVNFRTGKAFFTHNGLFLGSYFFRDFGQLS